MEKAVTASGGFPEVAKELGWKLAYKSKKPRGYWDDLNNMRREIEVRIDVNVNGALLPSSPPSSIITAGGVCCVMGGTSARAYPSRYSTVGYRSA